MGLLNINNIFERVKEPPVSCPICKGEMKEYKLSIWDFSNKLFNKTKSPKKHYRCSDCLNEMHV